MARGSKGGMQTAGLHYDLYCPKCGKPAARKEPTEVGVRYLHFTRKGSVWHEVKSAHSEANGAEPGRRPTMELIDSKELAKYAWSNPDVTVDGDGYISPFTVENFAEEHTIEAAPVVHGRWEEADWVEPDGHGFGTIRIQKAGLRCNQCGNVFKKELLWKDSYCPNCGARMDGGEGHETG